MGDSISSTHHPVKVNYYGSGGTGTRGSCARVSKRKFGGKLQQLRGKYNKQGLR